MLELSCIPQGTQVPGGISHGCVAARQVFLDAVLLRPPRLQTSSGWAPGVDTALPRRKRSRFLHETCAVADDLLSSIAGARLVRQLRHAVFVL